VPRCPFPRSSPTISGPLSFSDSTGFCG
jgi:hypothetical protein